MLTRNMNIADFESRILIKAIQNENQRQEHHIELIAFRKLFVAPTSC